MFGVLLATLLEMLLESQVCVIFQEDGKGRLLKSVFVQSSRYNSKVLEKRTPSSSDRETRNSVATESSNG